MKISPVAIFAALAVSTYRKVAGAFRFLIELTLEAPLVVLVVAVIAIGVPWFVVASIQREKAEREWVAAGICEPVMEQMYQPPATSSCSSYNKDGACTLWSTNQSPPYLRTLLNCEGKKEFWRRSDKLPQSMRDQVRKIGKKD